MASLHISGSINSSVLGEVILYRKCLISDLWIYEVLMLDVERNSFNS